MVLAPVDASGARLFHRGEVGAAHVAAHRALDERRIREGHDALAAFLRDRTGAGSDWAHVQWHLLVFELELGQVHAAHARYRRQLLPAIRDGVALTDGPSALWRLALDAPSLQLDWTDVCAVARRRLARRGEPDGPFVTLHHLLALAGAGDGPGLMAFAQRTGDGTLAACARALAAWTLGEFDLVVMLLDDLTPAQRAHVGGSAAQNELLDRIRDAAADHADHSMAA